MAHGGLALPAKALRAEGMAAHSLQQQRTPLAGKVWNHSSIVEAVRARACAKPLTAKAALRRTSWGADALTHSNLSM